ncbi:Leukocyte Immunoglobulin-Like Receptor Subfamily B Member 4 [Manis pentadactyla]|nr:Leukocyte Immunoglobulin-Like Receptor Subfamily B Member 4 [Manis pentadactyla]
MSRRLHVKYFSAKRSGPSEARLSGPRGAQRLHQGTAPVRRGSPGTPTVGRGTHLAWSCHASGSSVLLTVDEWKWSFSQTPFVPWPCAAWKPQAVSFRALGGGEDPRRGWSTRPSSSPPGAEEPEGTDQGLQDLQLHPALRARPASASPSAPGLGHLQIAGGRQTGPEPPQAMGWIGGCHSRDEGRDSEAWELRKCSQTAPADAEYLNLHSELVVTMFGSMVPSCA